MSVKTADFFRALDDSDLDVYEVRYLMRVWRRGKCWEKLQSISKTTGMSVGKASEVRRKLLDTGWLDAYEFEGRIVYEVAIPDCCSVSCNENDIHYVKENTDEVKQEFHVMKQDVHQVKPEFHVMSALPINRQKEDIQHEGNTIKQSAAGDIERREIQAAKDATVELIEFWAQLTKRNPPHVNSEAFRDDWFKPFNEIWISCGRSVDVAKAKVQAVRDAFLNDGRKIFDPAKLPAHVQAMVDTELLPITRRMNGHDSGPVVSRSEKAALEYAAKKRAILGGAS